jgi:hypothetical protein
LTLCSSKPITRGRLEALTDGTMSYIYRQGEVLLLKLGSTKAITLGLLKALTADGTAD